VSLEGCRLPSAAGDELRSASSVAPRHLVERLLRLPLRRVLGGDLDHAEPGHVEVVAGIGAGRYGEPVHDPERTRPSAAGPAMGAAPELRDDHRLVRVPHKIAQPLLVGGLVGTEAVEVDAYEVEAGPVDLSQ
jgi:hypothetical protein